MLPIAHPERGGAWLPTMRVDSPPSSNLPASCLRMRGTHVGAGGTTTTGVPPPSTQCLDAGYGRTLTTMGVTLPIVHQQPIAGVDLPLASDGSGVIHGPQGGATVATVPLRSTYAPGAGRAQAIPGRYLHLPQELLLV